MTARKSCNLCTGSGTSQVASEVHSTVASSGLALMLLFFQNEPCCTVLNSLQIDLFVPAGRPAKADLQ